MIFGIQTKWVLFPMKIQPRGETKTFCLESENRSSDKITGWFYYCGTSTLQMPLERKMSVNFVSSSTDGSRAA